MSAVEYAGVWLQAHTKSGTGCQTCHTYRPPRTSHCRLCDCCVALTDHHCTYLNNCIGHKNYLPFFVFLSTAVLCCVWSVCFCAYLVARQKRELPSDQWPGEWHVAGSTAVAAASFILLCPIGGLWVYHLRLVLTNMTTIEMVRSFPLPPLPRYQRTHT